ncbi:MAG: FMN-binding glutamate synthase family protein [Actinomycetia bacterium]|nr:FMN-binding glutamate synthase family protein [Actinomycetes bacterium]
MVWIVAVIVIVVGGFIILAVVDLIQVTHAVRRNFPIIGRLRYVLERIGPELRQYIVTDNDEERPFSRDQRRWVYSSAKLENPYFGFGTDNKMAMPQYLLIRHSAFPYMPPTHDDLHPIPVAKVMGEWRNRELAFRPASVVNISAMSYGSLSAPAVVSLNRGAMLAGCLHNTGEGGISDHHRHGGDLIFQLGTGYFGARDQSGRFNLDLLQERVAADPVRAIEIKLSQGAKPGLGGVLPAEKVTAEIAAVRGVEVGVTVASPARHAEFDSVSSMIDFIERLAAACRVPVGIKSAVGQRQFWVELADEMAHRGVGPDFITIDGGEGGTGAAPLVFSDNVALPFRSGFAEVYSTFASRDMHDKVVWIGSGKLGFPGEGLLAMTMGADMVNVGREPMLAIGCIQAQKCHTGHCPTGVATQSKWLMRGLDPIDKSARAANYVISLRHGLLQLANACGQAHPGAVGVESIGFLIEGGDLVSLREQYGYDPAWMAADETRLAEISSLMAGFSSSIGN